MEWQNVRLRIEAGEDRHTEFKRGLGDLSAICSGLRLSSTGPEIIAIFGPDYLRLYFGFGPHYVRMSPH